MLLVCTEGLVLNGDQTSASASGQNQCPGGDQTAVDRHNIEAVEER